MDDRPVVDSRPVGVVDRFFVEIAATGVPEQDNRTFFHAGQLAIDVLEERRGCKSESCMAGLTSCRDARHTAATASVSAVAAVGNDALTTVTRASTCTVIAGATASA